MNKKKALWGGFAVLTVLIVGVLILTEISVFQNKKSIHRGTHSQDPDPITYITGLGHYAASLRTPIKRLKIKNGWSDDDIHMMDFSLPGSETYGDNPSDELFNPEGGGAVFFTFDQKSDQGGETWYQKLNVTPEYHYLSSIRVAGLGSDKPELTLVVTGVGEEGCSYLHNAVRGRQNPASFELIPFVEFSKDIDLRPFPEVVPEENIITVVHDVDWACIKTPSGFHYYHILHEQ